MLVKTDFPVPCAAGMGNIYHRHLEITGEEKHGPTGIEQIFIPRSTAESLFHRGCYTTFQDPKQLTLDQLKQMKDAQGDFSMTHTHEKSERLPMRVFH